MKYKRRKWKRKHGMSLEERFWIKVDRRSENECWNWEGACEGGGYGHFRDNNKTIKAHRYSYEIHYGPIPDKMVVCHKCINNRRCVNPKHLKVGTARDNVNDTIKQGRLSPAFGDDSGNSKLTSSQVREIKKMLDDGIEQKYIAHKFSVSHVTISNIRSGRTWRHIVIC